MLIGKMDGSQFFGSFFFKIRYLPKLEKGTPIFSNSDAFLEKLTANLGGRVAWSNEALLAALDIQAARAPARRDNGKASGDATQ